MPSSNAIRAGRAFVEISGDDRKLRRTLRRVSRELRSVGRMLTLVGAVATAAAAAFAPLGVAAVRAASDAEESLSRFAAVFGSETDRAAKFAEDLARRIGRSSVEVKNALATYQSFFVGLGFGAREALELSEQMAALALDFASFHNLTDDEALGRFISALSGSSEVLDRFGINTKQAALEQELLRQGINKSWTEVTEQEKAIARLSIIMRTMTGQGAVGDAVRTADSFANQMKRVRANIHDTSIEIGRALIPVLKPAVSFSATALGIVKELVRANPALVAGIFAAAAGVGVLGVLTLAAGAAASFASIAFGALATVLGVILSPVALIVAGVTVLTVAVVALGGALLYYSGIGSRAIDALGASFKLLKATVTPILAAIAESLQAGNIEGAVQVLWSGVLVAWETGKQAVIQSTAELGVSIVIQLKRAMNKAAELFDLAAIAIVSSWLRIIDQITGTNLAGGLTAAANAGAGLRAAERAQELERLEDALSALLSASDEAGGAAIDAAKRQLEQAISDARAANEQLKATAAGSSPGIDFSGLTQAARRVFSSGGAFNALGGAAFAGNSPAERTAKAAESIKSSTQRIEREVTNAQGMVFT